jgi:hypothetical protein
MGAFYEAGGWGMHPVAIFGFLLVAASVLYLLRPEAKFRQLVTTLGMITFASGLLGTVTGIRNSARYLEQVEPAKQLQIFALGIEESLHVVILSLVIVIIAGLLAAVGTLRAPVRAA